MKNKHAQSITDAFSNIVKKSNHKPNLLETGDGKEYVNTIFDEFLTKNNIERYSTNTLLGAVRGERFNKTKRKLLKKQLFEKGNADWLIELSFDFKKYINTIHSSKQKTPIQASKKVSEKEGNSIQIFKIEDKHINQTLI